MGTPYEAPSQATEEKQYLFSVILTNFPLEVAIGSVVIVYKYQIFGDKFQLYMPNVYIHYLICRCIAR